MKLYYVSITNYRSITEAYKIDLSNLTVLLGKNNEGKTNIIKAINLGMEILHNVDAYHRGRVLYRPYEWNEDFPISLQANNRLKNKNTTIRFDFKLNDDEKKEFYEKIGSYTNGDLSIRMSISQNNLLSFEIPKRGKNTKSLSEKIVDIASFVCDKFDIQYIPAVRSEDDAYGAIADLIDTELSDINDEQYQNALEYIRNKQKEQLKTLSNKLKTPLSLFLPQIRDVNLRMDDKIRRTGISRRSIDMEIDDGALTYLSKKGDGVKSLATIALLSQVSSNKDRLIIVDEPENHLHPEAIHYIDGVLSELSKDNQVLISTHNPIFVSRSNISSNIIVESGQAQKAKRVDDIRNTLGVVCSDNLMFSDYVVVVEGPTDRDFLTKFFNVDAVLKNCLDSKMVTIRSIGGVNNLKSELYALQRYCCNFIVILDGDNAAKTNATEAQRVLSIPAENFRYFMRSARGESELEDAYKPEIYKDYLLAKGIDISNGLFRNQVKKWSDRIQEIATRVGITVTREMEDEWKQGVFEQFTMSIFDGLTTEGAEWLRAVGEKIKNDLRSMNII